MFAGMTALLLGVVLCSEAYDSLATHAQSDQTTSPPSIESVRQLTDLAILEITATEVATSSVNGHAGSTTATVLICGTITLTVDLGQTEFTEVDEDRQHLVLALPHPSVRRVEIDHRASRVLSCERSGLWNLAVGAAHEDRAISQAFLTGQQQLREQGDSDVFIQQARLHTLAVLSGFASELGWTVEVRWTE